MLLLPVFKLTAVFEKSSAAQLPPWTIFKTLFVSKLGPGATTWAMGPTPAAGSA